MTVERTLTIIKPDAVAKNAVGQIIARFEQSGLKVLAARLIHLTPAQAGSFYIVHKERPFYASLCAFMTQGPCMPIVLEGENAIARLRDLMGATDPAKAGRGRYGRISPRPSRPTPSMDRTRRSRRPSRSRTSSAPWRSSRARATALSA